MHDHFLGLDKMGFFINRIRKSDFSQSAKLISTIFKNHLPAPKIFGGEINLVETQELKIPGNEVKVPGSRNIHHISPIQNFQLAQNQHSTPRPRSTQAPHAEVFISFILLSY